MFLAVALALQTQTFGKILHFPHKTKLKAEEKNKTKVEDIELH